MKSRKAQAFMTDFMASIAIFGAILTLFMTMWSLGVDSQQSFDREDLLQEQAERTADFLVTTEGYPNNWEEEGVEARIPGFATSDNVLSAKKIKAFNHLSYERQTVLTKTQNFTLKFRDSETGEILQPAEVEDGEEDGTEGGELGNMLGAEPIAYIVQSGAEFSTLESLDNLNNSEREWYFYFPSEENQNELDDLTAEEVYTNEGSGRQMMERMISDAADKGWSSFTVGERVEASMISEVTDIDSDGGREVYYKDGDDILNYYDMETGQTTRVDSVTGFARMGAVADFTEEEGVELAYIDDNDQIAFYNLNTDTVTETTVNAQDLGQSFTNEDATAVALTNGNDNLAYYSQENGETVTAANGERVGGVSDIDGDGENEIAYMDGNGNLAYHGIESDSSEATSFQIQDVGWSNNGRTAVHSNSNDHFGYWNYTDSSFQNTGIAAESVSDFTQINGKDSILYLDTVENQDLAVYDAEHGVKKYLRTGDSQNIRASEGGYSVNLPDYGQSVAYQDSDGYLNFYVRSEDNTVRLNKRVDYVGGAADIDGDGSQEISYIDNDNRDLEYYDFEDREFVNAMEAGSTVRGKEVGEPADLDNDDSVELAYMTDNDNLGYYDFEDQEVVEFNSLGQIQTLGASKDVDFDDNNEIIYVQNGDTLAYYDPVDDEVEETGVEADYAGGAADITGSPEREIMYRNNDQQIAYYNTNTGETVEETTRIRRTGSMMQLNEDDGFDGIAINNDNRLGYFDFSLSLNYNTVISENADIQQNNVENTPILEQAVDQGMTYYHSRNDLSIIREVFGINTQDSGSDTGEVQKVEPLISSEFEVGDEVPFSNVQTAIEPTEADQVFVNSTASPDACLACGIKYGDGGVYYLADMSVEGTDNQASLNEPGEVISSAEAVGAGNPFNIGINPLDSANTVIAVDRQVAVNRSGELQKAEMDYIVWR